MVVKNLYRSPQPVDEILIEHVGLILKKHYVLASKRSKPHHMSKLYFLTSIFCLLSLAGLAEADDFSDLVYQPRGGLYYGGSVLYQFDYDITSSDIIGTSSELEFSLDDSFAFSGVVGAYLDRFRVEFEANFFETDYDDIEFLTTPLGIDGDLSYLSFLGNIYYDMPLGSDKFNLYLGAGAGVAIVQSDADLDAALINTTTVGGIVTTTAITEVDDTFSTFTYQVLAGLSYEPVDGVTFTGGYRLRAFSESGNAGEPSGLIFREHFISTFEVGVRFDF